VASFEFEWFPTPTVPPSIKRVLLAGKFDGWNLESSYRRAFEGLGCQVAIFDFEKAVDRHCRLGKFGRFFNRFVPVEAWVRKANRELVLQAYEFSPELVAVFGSSPICAGALAQLKASMDVSLVYVWPDPLVNLENHIVSGLRVIDLVATYSRSTVEVFERLGARRAVWVPLAADSPFQPVSDCTPSEKEIYAADITFVGGWRPEREQVLTKLAGFDMKIWGPDWSRRCKGNVTIMRAWQRRTIRGAEFAKAVRCSKVNLNVIDSSSSQGANMRFFEIPAAGGLQVSSSCPEMESEFRHNEHMIYYRTVDELPDLIASLRTNDELRQRVAAAGHARVMEKHTYKHRAETILEQVEALDGRKQERSTAKEALA
jgi:spore maturation protein CgeB